MSIPVSFVKGSRFAAIAEVGAVFSEMKFSVVPANCFHSSPGHRLGGVLRAAAAAEPQRGAAGAGHLEHFST